MNLAKLYQMLADLSDEIMSTESFLQRYSRIAKFFPTADR